MNLAIALMQWGLAGEIGIKEPPGIERRRDGIHAPFRGATTKNGDIFPPRPQRHQSGAVGKSFAGSRSCHETDILASLM
ncbi:MAG: hypothetical protein ACLRY7_04400 [Hominenteromicrobium sp.]|uniref:hypothetical protein n=1 Tax=Hominenteromicrobium sp. TaxID=3073581 RepID=UPI0039A16A0F